MSSKPDLLVSVTGSRREDWQGKLKEIDNYGLEQAALFLSRFERPERAKIYQALLDSKVKEWPLIHMRNDMDQEELRLLDKHFHVRFFNFHESGFMFLNRWPNFHHKILLETNTDNILSPLVQVERIGGFCIDLAHFKATQINKTKEYKYTMSYRDRPELFVANHLGGYDEQANADLHHIGDLSEFNYLKELPSFIFSPLIALELENSIAEQLSFRDYLYSNFF